MSCCKKLPNRRTFLAGTGAAATAAVTLAACAPDHEQDTFSGGTLTKALQLDDLPPGDSVQMAVGANQVLIHRENQDTVHAYSAVCTHQGCIVGVKDDATSPFVCPCHASNFDKLTGDAVSGPAQRPLTRHETAIEDGWILVAVEPA